MHSYITGKGILILKKIRRFFFHIICLCFLLCTAAGLVPEASAVSSMKASESCVEFIKKVEGFSAKPYYDYGQHTVGYGTKCPTEKYLDYYTNGIPREEAEDLLRKTIAGIEKDIHEKLTDKYSLTFTQNQFDALVSFTFNLGSRWMTYDSILRNAVINNAGEEELIYAFSLYSTAGGKYLSSLIVRRLCEANIYINGVYDNRLSNTYGYVLYEPNGGSLTYRAQGFLCGTHTAPVADAVRSGDTFLGWYTDLTGGTKVTELDKSLTGKTLFARWQSDQDSEAHDSPSFLVRVTGDVLNVRKGPGTNYGIAMQVRRNDQLLVSHVSEISNMRWGRIQEGWICLDYTDYDTVVNGTGATDTEDQPQPPAETSPPAAEEPGKAPDAQPEPQQSLRGTVRVNDLLRIRSGPGTTYDTVGYLPSGRSVEILEQKTNGTMTWGRISRGWVSMDYIRQEAPSTPPETEAVPETTPVTEPEQEASDAPSKDKEPEEPAPRPEPDLGKGKVTADALRIRSGPGADNRILGFYYQNDTVVILEKILVNSVYWGKTDQGWIHMDYVQSASSPEGSTPVEGREMTVIADCLRVRRQTSTDSRIAQLLYYGDTVTVFETTTVEDVVWGKVSNGWICMDYVK